MGFSGRVSTGAGGCTRSFINDDVGVAPKFYWDWFIENTILWSCDGLEDRVIAKDLLYKFNELLVSERGRGIYLEGRLSGYHVRPVGWSVRKRFVEFLRGETSLTP